MVKSLEIVNEFIENIEDTMKEIKSGPFHDIRLLDLNKFKTIKQDLEVFEILLKYIRFEENYTSVDGQSLTFNYDRIILKALNNFDLIGIPLPQVKEKIKDFVIVKTYILTNKVGDNHD